MPWQKLTQVSSHIGWGSCRAEVAAVAAVGQRITMLACMEVNNGEGLCAYSLKQTFKCLREGDMSVGGK